MSRQKTPPVFLQRASYRQQRVRDAAKLVPFLGVVLFAIPLAWTGGDGEGKIGSSGLLYIFGAWVVLIVLSAFFSTRIRASGPLSSKDAPDK